MNKGELPSCKEAMEIFKKHDPKLYDYYSVNAQFLGGASLGYAAYLMEKSRDEQEENE